MAAEPLTPSFLCIFNGINHAGLSKGMLEKEATSHDDLCIIQDVVNVLALVLLTDYCTPKKEGGCDLLY